MKIKDLQNNILSEGVLLTEQRSYKLWESAGQKILEAQLTVDQIQQLFQQVEQGATAAGGNRTMLGKGKDAAAAVNKAWEDLKTKVQNSGPIQAVDQAYDGAVAKIEAGLGGPDNAVNQIIQKYRKFAKEHPIAQGFIYSALIAAAGISGAGLGGAAVLGLLKMADKLLQGEKFSSAAYSGAKTGAMAYGASKIGDMIKGKPEGELTPDQIKAAADQVAPVANTGSVVPPEDIVSKGFRAVMRSAMDAGKNYVNNGGATDYASIQSAAEEFGNALLAQGMRGDRAQQMVDIFKTSAKGAAARALGGTAQSVAGGALQAVTNSIDRSGKKLTDSEESQTQRNVNSKTMLEAVDRDLTVRMWALNESLGKPRGGVHLTEAGIKDMMGKAANWVATKGKNLTTKVTADKLMQAWKKAGSPTDSEQVAQILGSAGVAPDIIANTYKAAGIPAPTAPSTDTGLGAIGNVSPGDDAKTGAPSDQTTPGGPSTTDATTSATPTTTGTASPAAPTGQAPAASTAAPTGGAPAGTAPAAQSAGGPDAFIQNLIASFNALTPAEKAEIQKELQIAMDASENTNVVKATNESRRARK